MTTILKNEKRNKNDFIVEKTVRSKRYRKTTKNLNLRMEYFARSAILFCFYCSLLLALIKVFFIFSFLRLSRASHSEPVQTSNARKSVTIVTVTNVQQQTKLKLFGIHSSKKKLKNNCAVITKKTSELPLIKTAGGGDKTDETSSATTVEVAAISGGCEYSQTDATKNDSGSIKTIVRKVKTKMKKQRK